MGFNLPLLNRRRRSGGGPQSPVDLFSSGAQGIWYDPADLTTMFQDSAGTIPVTAPGQPVGRRVDLSGRSNHSIQAVANSRLTYGIEPKTGRRNIFTFSEDFTNAVWVKTGGATVAIVSGETKLVSANATSRQYLSFTLPTLTLNNNYTYSIKAKAGELQWLRLFTRNEASTSLSSWFNLSTGVVGTVGHASASISPLGSGWYSISVTLSSGAADTTTALAFIELADGDNIASVTGNGTNGLFIDDAQFELGSTVTAYQRVTTAFDVTETGVASCPYVQYDGIDDSMGTAAAIDFTGADAMSVFTGIRRSSDAALGTVLELGTDSTNNNGSFALRSPNTTASAAYSYVSRGTALSLTTSPASFAAPRHNVLTGLSDISADQSVLRVNGVQVSSNTADQGTGTYANQTLFSGRRNNTSQPFSGRDFGMLVVGKNASAAEIAFMEAWFAARTPTVTL